MPNPFKKPKRPYRLSAAGAAALRKSALKTRPWLLSPGPSTPEGKLAIRNNNLKHGYYAKVSLPEANAYKAFRKSLTRAGVHQRGDPGPPVIEP
jgi:hypothetical protein